MLINCVAYQEGTRLVDLPVEEISDYLDKPDCFVWVALRDPTAQELDAMRREFDLHPSPWKMPVTATSGPRWTSTATRSLS
jgi:magnesium transporter